MGKTNSITSRIRKFKHDLKDSGVSETRIVRKYIIFGTPYIFNNNEEKYYELKEEIADFFKVSPSNVIMVGSAKLGFSINPKTLWRHITIESDIDITIINEKLFDDWWKELFEFNINITPRSNAEDIKYKKFLEYFFRGWLRPDLFPFDNPKQTEWFSFLKSLYNKYDNRKVTVGMFRSEYFFESYQKSNIKNIAKEGI